MEHVYVVLGAGKMGKAAAYDLVRFGDAAEVRLLDIRPEEARDGALRVNGLCGTERVRGAGVDGSDPAKLDEALRGATAVMSCLPYWLNPELARAALRAGAHFNDLGGNTDVVKQELALHDEARRAGVSIVPDCGLAPGLVNTLAAAGIARLATCDAVELRCGGLPQEPKGTLQYGLVFSISGLVNEYTGLALCLRAGRLAEVEALTELEEVAFPGFPPLEAFVTTGGSSTAPESFQGRVRSYDYKTIRYRGHAEKIRCLDELGLFSQEPLEVDGLSVVPRRVFEAAAEPRLADPDIRDLILTRATCRGTDPQGRRVAIAYELVDRHDDATGFSAMARCTSFPAATVTILQARGQVEPGARPLELAVEPEPFLEELGKRDLDLTERVEILPT